MEFKNNKGKKILSSLLSLTIIIFVVLFDFFTIYFNTNVVEAATIGPVNPSTAVNTTGIGTTAWLNPVYVYASDNSRSTGPLSRDSITNYLIATGFDFSAIPDGAVILGITVEVRRSEFNVSNRAAIRDYEVKIVQNGSISSVQNKAQTGVNWPAPASEGYTSYGGSADLWGLSWTSADIKNPNFGVAISAKNTTISGGGGNETARINHIRISVEYSSGPLTTQSHFRWRNDDGTEATATWKATEDSNIIGNIDRNTPIRLRIKSQNNGTAAELVNRTYELQYGLKTTTCDAIGSWIGVGNNSDAFDMVDSQLVEGTSITSERLTGVSSFVNGEEREISDTTGSIGLLSVGAGTELEYSIQATNLATSNSTYCFRLYDSNNAEALGQYDVYPEATVALASALDQISYRWRNDDGGESSGSQSVGFINPNGDYNINWNTVSPSGAHFSTIDEGATPSTADYIADNNIRTDEFEMETITGSGFYDRVDVMVYARTNNNDDVTVNIIINGAAQSAQTLSLTTSYGWLTASFTGLNLSQSDLDSLRVRLTQFKQGPSELVRVATMRAEVFGTTTGASFKAAENTEIIDQAKSENVRLRFLIKNSGPDSSGSQDFRLQFAPMVGESCLGGDETFASVPAQSGCGSAEVCMTNSGNITDQASSSNIASGLIDPSGSFVIGKLVTNPSNQATSITLNNNEFTELEYNFQFTTNATDGGDYCFRVDKSGSNLSTYTQIARATVVGITGYATSGTYISSEYNISSAGIFNVIEWAESTTNPSCLSCTIKLQIKTAPDNGGTPGTWSATWSGPQGEDGDETDFFTVNTGELIHTDHNNDQWIQYRATLEGDGVDTPILENVRVNYKTL